MPITLYVDVIKLSPMRCYGSALINGIEFSLKNDSPVIKLKIHLLSALKPWCIRDL